MNKQPSNPSAAADCPRRIWVMMAFSDDEVGISTAEPAPGLRLHLAKCVSCRALADRLSKTRSELASLATGEPSAMLVDVAQSQALASARRVVQGIHLPEGDFDLSMTTPDDNDEAWSPSSGPFARLATWLPLFQSGAGVRSAIAATLLIGVVGVWSWSRFLGDSSRDDSPSSASRVGAWIVDWNQATGRRTTPDSTSDRETAHDMPYGPGLDGEPAAEPLEFSHDMLTGGGDPIHPDAARRRPSRIRRALEPTTFEGAPGAWIGQSASPRPARKASKLDISRSEQSTEDCAADR